MTLTWPVVLAVLFGALLHASWNALSKSGADKALDTALVHFMGALVALPFMLWFGLPARAGRAARNLSAVRRRAGHRAAGRALRLATRRGHGGGGGGCDGAAVRVATRLVQASGSFGAMAPYVRYRTYKMQNIA